MTLAAAPGSVSSQAETTDDEYESTIEAYQTQVAELEGTVSARGKKINAQRTQIAELRSQLEPTAEPTSTAAPIDNYSASGEATDGEIAYFRDVQDILQPLVSVYEDQTRLLANPELSSDIGLWYELVEALRPYHDLYAEWQELSPPTARLENFHNAMTDALYNFDKAATNWELGVTQLESSYMTVASDHMQSATSSLSDALGYLDSWELEADFDISESL